MLDVDDRGIEGAADLCQGLGMLFVVRIGARFEELAIAPGTADILGWATAGCFDQTRIRDPGRRIGDVLDADGVFPAAAEVVEVFSRMRGTSASATGCGAA